MDGVRSRTDASDLRQQPQGRNPGHFAQVTLNHFGEHIMNFIVWLIVGGVIGWLASIMMKTNDQQGIVLNVVVGIVGAMIAGWFITPLVGVGTINQDNFSLAAMLVSFVGAAILLAVVNLFRRGTAR